MNSSKINAHATLQEKHRLIQAHREDLNHKLDGASERVCAGLEACLVEIRQTTTSRTERVTLLPKGEIIVYRGTLSDQDVLTPDEAAEVASYLAHPAMGYHGTLVREIEGQRQIVWPNTHDG